MAVIRNVDPRIMEKLRKFHDILYCQAKLSNEKHWGMNDTLNYLLEKGGE